MKNTKTAAEIAAEVEDLTVAGWEYPDALDHKAREYRLSRTQVCCVTDEYDRRSDPR